MEVDFENWYVLSTQSGKELKIKKDIENLTNSRYNLYVPCRELFYRFKGVYQKVVRPLFPGYIFIHREIESIQTIIQNSHLKDQLNPLLFDRRFAMVKKPEMALLLKIAGPAGLIKTSIATLCKDQTVVIESGPLKDLAGRILYIDKRKRKAMIQVELLDRSMRVAVGLEVVNSMPSA